MREKERIIESRDSTALFPPLKSEVQVKNDRLSYNRSHEPEVQEN